MNDKIEKEINGFIKKLRKLVDQDKYELIVNILPINNSQRKESGYINIEKLRAGVGEINFPNYGVADWINGVAYFYRGKLSTTDK